MGGGRTKKNKKIQNHRPKGELKYLDYLCTHAPGSALPRRGRFYLKRTVKTINARTPSGVHRPEGADSSSREPIKLSMHARTRECTAPKGRIPA